MKNEKHTLRNHLLAQDDIDNQAHNQYERSLRRMIHRKMHWIWRLLCGLAALGGIAFAISLIHELCEPMHHDVEVFIKVGMGSLLLCVVFYTILIGVSAIRGTVRFGSVMPVVLGGVILSGFFICLWTFLIFVLPKLYELSQSQINASMGPDFWIIGMVCIFLFIGFFGVLTAGMTFIIHLLYKHYCHIQRKLLEIELAIADISEKLPPDNDESAGVPR